MIVQDLDLEQTPGNGISLSQSPDEKVSESNDEQSNVVNLPVNQ
jgi:hypothetical protein